MAPCSRCSQPAVIHLRYSGASLCRDHFLRFFEQRANQEIHKQGRIQPGTVAVALSGGKDSVSVLHFLQGMLRERPGVRLVAITVDEGIVGYRESALGICRDLCTKWGIDHHVVRVADLAGYTIDQYAAGTHGPKDEQHPNAPRPSCGPCGVFRRQGMNKLAKDLGAAVLVTGHNLDDQAQTVLMNHLKGDLDRAARLAPHDEEDAARHDGLVRRMMPFRSIPEKEVLLYAILHDLPLHGDDGAGTAAECPYAERSHRFAMRDVLVGLEEMHPGTRHALLKGQDRLKPILRAALAPLPVVSCPTCGDPTSGDRCAACQWKA
jgi:uncharacterized protein (TIGR00269 family)